MAIEMEANRAMELLKQVAAQSYGSGYFEGVKGGEGSIGMIGGKPVKFNTHWKERRAEATPEMIKSSNELREALWSAANQLSENGEVFDSRLLEGVRNLLGLDGNGSAAANKTLLSRKVAADVLHTIDAMRNEHKVEGQKENTFKGAKNLAKSSKGVSTKFADVVARNPAEVKVPPPEEPAPQKMEIDEFVGCLCDGALKTPLGTTGPFTGALRSNSMNGMPHVLDAYDKAANDIELEMLKNLILDQIKQIVEENSKPGFKQGVLIPPKVKIVREKLDEFIRDGYLRLGDAVKDRYLSGDLKPSDIKSLNARPMGTPVPVKVKYSEDLAILQTDFDNHFKANVSVGKLDGLNEFFIRQFEYEISGETNSVRGGTSTDDMNNKVKALFEGDENMLCALDAVFKNSLSVFELDHSRKVSNVTLLPDVNLAKSVEQSIKLSKNTNGSYHVDYRKHVEGSKQYTFLDAPEKLHMLENEESETNDFWDFSLSFDIERVGATKIVVKPSGDFSTLTFQLPATGFKQNM